MQHFFLMGSTFSCLCNQSLKKQIDKALSGDYEKFSLEEYVQNPVALARISAGVTQEALALELKVTQAYISKIENQSAVSPKLLIRVQKALESLSKSKK